MIPDESVAAELRGRWQNSKRSSGLRDDINAVRWEQLKHTLQSGRHKAQGLRRCVKETVFSFSYPMIDMEVSKHMNHLLKAPFCVHPKTGRVCVSIDLAHCHEFDPTAVPKLTQLLQELNSGGMGEAGDNDWDRTSLRESVKVFQILVLGAFLYSS